MTAEAQLIERLRQGDPAAFDALYAAEKAALYGFLLRLSRDQHVAADLFQNTWLKLAKNAGALRPESNLRAWLYTVARNEFLSYRRAQAFDTSRLLAFGRSQPESASEAGLDAELLALEAGLDQLNDADREVLLLCGAESREPLDVAQVLGISAVALRQRLARARKRLKDLMERERLPAAALGARRRDQNG